MTNEEIKAEEVNMKDQALKEALRFLHEIKDNIPTELWYSYEGVCQGIEGSIGDLKSLIREVYE